MKVKNNIAVSDSGFIFNPSTGESFSVNPISKQIMEWMSEGKSDSEIIDIVVKIYATDKDTVEKDLYEFIELLKSYQLVEELKE